MCAAVVMGLSLPVGVGAQGAAGAAGAGAAPGAGPAGQMPARPQGPRNPPSLMQPLAAPIDLKFDFSAGAAKDGYTRVAPTAVYSDDVGYGYEPGATVTNGDGGNTTTSDKPFLFSAKVPEGDFNVVVTFGDSSVATTSTFKAESGRLMLERVEVPAGKVETRKFTTNVRTPHLPKLPNNATGREEVTLDQFDPSSARDWDDKLTVEVVSPHAALRSIEIVSAPAAITVFVAGDSTVTDRDGGGDVSWGQMLPVFFKPGVAVANNAQSGETMKSFMNALRLDKMLSQMKKGDYLFMQFIHNDSKASVAADVCGGGDDVQGVSEGVHRGGAAARRDAGVGDGHGPRGARDGAADARAWRVSAGDEGGRGRGACAVHRSVQHERHVL
jgi:hypothetical protein